MYNVILSDPAWKQGKGGKKSVRENSSGGKLDYETITLDDIKEIHKQVRDLSMNNHAFFCWTIEKYLRQTEDMMYDLGYKLHSRMVWNKVTGIPAAFTIRFGHEYLLWFWYGKFQPIAKEMRGKYHSVFHEKVKAHSLKPNVSYDMIRNLYPDAKRIELFCRNKRRGFDGWGNEIKSDININGFIESQKTAEGLFAFI